MYDSRMAKRVTVNLPDDIAEYLDTLDDPSAAVADALRARIDRAAATLAQLRAAGFNITEESLARARGKLPPFTPEQRAEIQRRYEMILAGTWPPDDGAG